MVLSRVRELVGHPGEVINKAHLYDQLMESVNPSLAREMLQILVKYSRSMKNLLKELKKTPAPTSYPRWIFDPGPPRYPMGTFYEVLGEVKLVSMVQIGVGPSQSGGTKRPHEFGNIPDQEKTFVSERTRSSQVLKKNTEQSARSVRGQSSNLDRGEV